jgi:hypothetical protein
MRSKKEYWESDAMMETSINCFINLESEGNDVDLNSDNLHLDSD